jgi:hypothetical protein
MEKEREAAVNKNGKRRGREQRTQDQLMLSLRGLARAALWDTVVIRTGICRGRNGSGACLLMRTALRTSRGAPGAALRARAELAGDGRPRVKVKRPRACDVDKLSLPSWRAWSSRDPLDERAFGLMMLGVSTRRYARSLEALPHDIEVRRTGKSAVSERFRSRHPAPLAEMTQRDLSGLALVAVMIDGVRFADHVVLAAVGIESRPQARLGIA